MLSNLDNFIFSYWDAIKLTEKYKGNISIMYFAGSIFFNLIQTKKNNEDRSQEVLYSIYIDTTNSFKIIDNACSFSE